MIRHYARVLVVSHLLFGCQETVLEPGEPRDTTFTSPQECPRGLFRALDRGDFVLIRGPNPFVDDPSHPPCFVTMRP